VPAQSPILRAGAIGLVFCTAVLIRREGNSINTLSLAAIIILLFSPLELFSIGWQLSFGCVLGILLFSSRLEFLFYDAVSGVRRQNLWSEDLRNGIGPRFLRASVTLMATGIAAWLGGAGLMLYHFCNITPLASLWTALTSPLMAAIMVLGYIKIMLSAILPTLGAILAPVTSMLAWAFIESVKLMARVSVSEIVIGHVAIWVAVFYYVAILYMPMANWPRRGAKRMVAIAMPAVLVMSIGMLKWQRMHPADAEFTCLSVGHGQAAVANLPEGSFLFDCGSMSLKDCGRRAVMPFLRWQGYRSPSWIFLSHGDTDHCNGIPEIMAGCRPEAVFVSGLFESDMSVYGKDAVLKNSIGAACRQVNAGDRLNYGGAVITTLWPTGGEETAGLADNDKSLVTLIDFAGRRILISSDIQQHAQKQILAMYPDLKADVVIAPHHGSVTSRYRGFIDALKPEAVIYSCDTVQMERVLKADIAITEAKAFFTSRDGAVTVRIGKDGSMSISSFAGAHKKGHASGVPFDSH
jgi:competence protein ComEC